VARRPGRLAFLENMCQRASEDFVPPAAQRKAVRRTPDGRSPTGFHLSPKQVTFLTTELQRSEVTSLGYFFTSSDSASQTQRERAGCARHASAGSAISTA